MMMNTVAPDGAVTRAPEMYGKEDLDNRFTPHRLDEERTGTFLAVLAGAHDIAYEWAALLPDGREKSLAITNLEAAAMWAGAALARVDGEGNRL